MGLLTTNWNSKCVRGPTFNLKYFQSWVSLLGDKKLLHQKEKGGCGQDSATEIRVGSGQERGFFQQVNIDMVFQLCKKQMQ